MKDLRLGDLKAGEGPILVTGHTGFKGAWLTILLENLGLPVVGYSLEPNEQSLYGKLRMRGRNEEIFEDIRDKRKLEKFIKKTKPKGIIHLAAQALVLESYKFPIETFETNVVGTANLLEAAGKFDSVKAVIVVTTDKVYLNENTGKRFVETDRLQGKDPYSASKVGSEAAADAWSQIYSTKGGPLVGKARAGNVIGGGDLSHNRLLPDLVRAYFDNKTCLIRNPESTRPWQHVLDPLFGYVLYLSHLMSGKNIHALNFGPMESSLMVKNVVDIVQKVWNPIAINFEVSSRPESRESISLELDSKLANELLGWVPTWNQEEAVLQTLNWWTQVKSTKSAIDITEEEVKRFILN